MLLDSLVEPQEFDEELLADVRRRWQSIEDGTAVVYDEEEAAAMMFGPLDDD